MLGTKGYFSIEPENDLLIRVMSYGYKKRSNLGRLDLFSSSIQYLSRELRYYLFNELNYVDIDLKNAHPSIFYTTILNYFFCRQNSSIKRISQKP